MCFSLILSEQLITHEHIALIYYDTNTAAITYNALMKHIRIAALCT